MKNKKIVIALFVFAVILLGGMTAGMLQGMFPEEDTYKVVIRYNVVNGKGESTLYDTYSENHALGEYINISSPQIEGYKPNKEKVVAIVGSELFVTVNYECAEHVYDESEDVVLKYPTSKSAGIIQHNCAVCGICTEEFTTLSRTIVFGGDIIDKFIELNPPPYVSVDDYILKPDEELFVLLKAGAPEWDIILDGVKIDNSRGIGAGATVTVDYDKTAWNNAVIEFKQDCNESIDADYYIRIANSWRVNFGFEKNPNREMEDFILSEDCPLRTAPLTITLTYDYTK